MAAVGAKGAKRKTFRDAAVFDPGAGARRHRTAPTAIQRTRNFLFVLRGRHGSHFPRFRWPGQQKALVVAGRVGRGLPGTVQSCQSPSARKPGPRRGPPARPARSGVCVCAHAWPAPQPPTWESLETAKCANASPPAGDAGDPSRSSTDDSSRKEYSSDTSGALSMVLAPAVPGARGPLLTRAPLRALSLRWWRRGVCPGGASSKFDEKFQPFFFLGTSLRQYVRETRRFIGKGGNSHSTFVLHIPGMVVSQQRGVARYIGFRGCSLGHEQHRYLYIGTLWRCVALELTDPVITVFGPDDG